MTIDEASEFMSVIKFPNAEFYIKEKKSQDFFTQRYGSFATIQICHTVPDSTPPHNIVKVYSTRFTDLADLDKNLLYFIVWDLLKSFLIHDASEWFSINGTLPHNPHISEFHDEALSEYWTREAREAKFLGVGIGHIMETLRVEAKLNNI